MTTNAKKANIYLKKFLTQQQMTENFLEYLKTQITENFSHVWQNDGIFTPNISATPLYTFSTIDAFDLVIPLIGTNGIGNLLNLDASLASTKFENSLGINYHVGLRYNEIPDETEVNVRTGKIKYTFIKESIGELAEPDTVTDDGDGTLTIIVDSVCEVGVSNAGRKIKVWLKEAVGQTDAFEELTVIWDGSNNVIETTTALGQVLGSISIDPSDYKVFLLGPTVKRNTDLSLDPTILYLGTVEGAGAGNIPSNYNSSGVNQLFSQSNNQSLLDSTFSFLVGGGLISWDLTTSTLSWSSDIKLILPHRGFDFTILASSIAGIAEGEVLYIVKDDIGGNKSLIKVSNGNVPNDPSSEPIAVRYGGNIYFKNGSLELIGDAGSITTGRIDGITEDILNYIGAISESDEEPTYASASIITQNASLTQTIGELDSAVNAIITDDAEEEDFVVSNPLGQTVFTATTMAWENDNTKFDILVFVNGRKRKQSKNGLLDEDFRKISTTQIEFSEPILENSRVTIHSVRTGGGGGGSVVTVSGEWKVEYHVITAGEIVAKQFNLTETPSLVNHVLVDVLQGSSQRDAVDYTIIGNVFNWSGLGLDGQLNAGDVIRFGYFFVP